MGTRRDAPGELSEESSPEPPQRLSTHFGLVRTYGFAQQKGSRPTVGFFQSVDKAVKVFAHLFQKAAQSRARSPRRRPQTAKPSYRRFLFAALRSKVCVSLCAYMVKEKASFSFVLFGGQHLLSTACERTSVGCPLALFYRFLSVIQPISSDMMLFPKNTPSCVRVTASPSHVR